jgi:hypothetical protein
VELPAWGIAVIALYSLLQIPAVVLVARYCEVDPGDLPTPPMRRHWRGDESDGTAPEDPKESENLTARPPPGGGVATDGVRCGHCGERNDPSFVRCRRCVEPL